LVFLSWALDECVREKGQTYLIRLPLLALNQNASTGFFAA
jgi:hypothetical protein